MILKSQASAGCTVGIFTLCGTMILNIFFPRGWLYRKINLTFQVLGLFLPEVHHRHDREGVVP